MTEDGVFRAHARQQEKPSQWEALSATRESPPSPATRENLCVMMKTQHSQKYTHTYISGLPSQPSWQRICVQGRRPQSDSWVWKTRWRRARLPIPLFLGFPCGSACKKSTLNVGDLGSIPGLERSPGEGKGNPL